MQLATYNLRELSEDVLKGYRAILNGAAINFPEDLALSGEL